MLFGTFKNPTTIYFGDNHLDSLGSFIKDYGSKVLIIHGGRSYEKLGLNEKIPEILKKSTIEFFSIGGVQPNPSSDLVYEGIELCKKEKIDFILAVGGGSVIDTAKAVGIGSLYHGDFFDFFEKKLSPHEMLPIGVVLTIFGAGSESSDGAVITKDKRKYTCGSPFMYPQFAILNPNYMHTVPKYLLSCGIVDAVSHVLERYFSATDYAETSTELCEALVRSIIHNADNFSKDPKNFKILADLMWAAKLAHDNTVGFGRKHDWASHTIANELGARYGVQHGALLAVIFPAWMEFMAPEYPHVFRRFATNIFGIKPSEGVGDLDISFQGIKAYKKFIEKQGLVLKLSELGIIGNEHFLEIAESCSKTTASGTIGNLKRLTKDETVKILDLCV